MGKAESWQAPNLKEAGDSSLYQSLVHGALLRKGMDGLQRAPLDAFLHPP